MFGTYLFVDLPVVLCTNQIRVLWNQNVHSFNMIGGRLLLLLLLDYGFHLLNIIVVEMGLRQALQPILRNVFCLWVTSQNLTFKKLLGQLRNFDSPIPRTFAFTFPFKSSVTRYGRPLISSLSKLVLSSLNNRHHFLTFPSFATLSLSISATRMWIAM